MAAVRRSSITLALSPLEASQHSVGSHTCGDSLIHIYLNTLSPINSLPPNDDVCMVGRALEGTDDVSLDDIPAGLHVPDLNPQFILEISIALDIERTLSLE